MSLELFRLVGVWSGWGGVGVAPPPHPATHQTAAITQGA
jgi:hypothetical protein